MDRSEDLNLLAQDFIKFQQEVEDPIKSMDITVSEPSGNSYDHSYAPLHQTGPYLRGLLNDHGLSLPIFPSASKTYVLLLHKSGQFLGVELDINMSHENPQKVGAIVTYFRRYIMEGVTGVVSQEDDDANSAMGNDVTVNDRRRGPAQPDSDPKQAPSTKKERPASESKPDDGKQAQFKPTDQWETEDYLNEELVNEFVAAATDKNRVLQWHSRAYSILGGDNKDTYRSRHEEDIRSKLTDLEG